MPRADTDPIGGTRSQPVQSETRRWRGARIIAKQACARQPRRSEASGRGVVRGPRARRVGPVAGSREDGAYARGVRERALRRRAERLPDPLQRFVEIGAL